MIDEDSESSSETIILQNSPEQDECFNTDLIEDSSTPLKEEQYSIIDASSPESSVNKPNVFLKRKLTRPKESPRAKRKLLDLRPRLSIKSKKYSPKPCNEPRDQLPASFERPAFLIGTIDISNDDMCRSTLSNHPNNIDEDSPIKLCPEDSEDRLPAPTFDMLIRDSQHSDVDPGKAPISFDSSDIEAETSGKLIEKLQICEDFSQQETDISGVRLLKDDKEGEAAGPDLHVDVDASIQIKSSVAKKAPKKGSLTEKFGKAELLLKKESALFSHEIDVGLRTSKGALVSDVLEVVSINDGDPGYLVECWPLFCDSADIPSKDHSLPCLRLFLLLNGDVQKLSKKHVLIHFPVTVMFDPYAKLLMVIAEKRYQIISNFDESKICDKGNVAEINCPEKMTNMFWTLSSKTSKNILDAVFGHLLYLHSSLELEVLHIIQRRETKETVLLSKDSMNQFCFVRFNDEYKCADIEANKRYSISKLRLKKCGLIPDKIREVAKYFSCHLIKHDYLFEFEPVCEMFSVIFLKEALPMSQSCYTLQEVHQKITDERRIMIYVSTIVVEDSGVLIGDHLSLNLTKFENKGYMVLPEPPLYLEAVYFSDGIVYADEFSKFEKEKNLVS